MVSGPCLCGDPNCFRCFGFQKECPDEQEDAPFEDLEDVFPDQPELDPINRP